MPKLTKRQQIINYFTKNPDAPISKVADRFKVAPSNIYPLRKLALAVPVPENISTARSVEPAPAPAPELSVPDFLMGRANDRQVGGDYYKEMGIEPWDVVDTWPLEQRIGAYRFGLLKYTMRLGSKDASLMDAGKAQHYGQKLMEVLSNAEGA